MKIDKAELFLNAIIEARASGNVALERFLIQRAKQSMQRGETIRKYQTAITYRGKQIIRPVF